MNRMARAALLTKLLNALRNEGSWCGETHVQKSLYLLQEIFRIPLEFEFILYKQGPFSFDLRDELTSLRADDLVKLEAQPIPYGPRLVPTESATDLLSRFPKTMAMYGAFVAFIAKRLGSRGVAGLERLATAMFVTRRQSKAPIADRAAALVGLKPHIPMEDALDAVREADAMLEEASQVS
jgi:hypothetical protein